MSEMIEEFERFFERGDQDECWPWKGRLQSNKSGMLYGYFKKGLRANRVAYKFYCGAIPPSAVVRHRCDNSICVNPRHLEIGTQKQNVHDRYERGRARHLRGEGHARHRLTTEQVLEIRSKRVNGQTIRALADEYNVSTYGIMHATKYGWKHV